ncbi:MAG TPA: 4'-phosphopantetheinyl transferase superfamily protein [Chitinophagales bacterium]|nr:4'-phosphopantetheinyl transferase superfamily protein [Chitinophagales bacterium]HNJ60422.1 4'-phosphopantetheinyl transferase superfamily protein [Chitinophagales bacterium]
MDVYFIHIDNFIWSETMENDIGSFPENIHQKINAYKSIEHKIHDYYGKKIIQFLLQKYQPNYALCDLKYTEKGKPYFVGDFDINISHSGNFVVGVYVENAQVGIDIEKHRNIEALDFKKYFSENEWNTIQHSENPLITFFDFWAIKESAIKCNGNGFKVLSKTQTFDEKSIQCVDEIYNYRQITIDNNYSCSVCCNNKIETINLIEISL